MLNRKLTTMALTALVMGAGFIWDDIKQISESPTIAGSEAPIRYFSLNVVESWGSKGRGGEGGTVSVAGDIALFGRFPGNLTIDLDGDRIAHYAIYADIAPLYATDD